MPSSRILKAGAVALVCAATASATTEYAYTLSDAYTGDFRDRFTYNSSIDSGVWGYVNYQDKASAESQGLTKYANGQTIVGVDSTNTVSSSESGRKSVRLESTATYNHGLFIIDIAHLPVQACGLWPAFWTADQVNYPSGGEIDFIENINIAESTLTTLHTSPGFSIGASSTYMKGAQAAYQYKACDSASTDSAGCSSISTSGSYGSAFNAQDGGVFAMEWTSDAIKVWNWPSASVPEDITSGSPVPSVLKWGLPQFSTEGGQGSVDDFFHDQQIIINTDFCGSWAGQQSIWESTTSGGTESCKALTGYKTCNEYVANEPSAFAGAYWGFNSIKVYQKAAVAATSSSAAQSSTSPATPSSSTSSEASTTSVVASSAATSAGVSSNISSAAASSAASSDMLSTPASSASASVTSSGALSTPALSNVEDIPTYTPTTAAASSGAAVSSPAVVSSPAASSSALPSTTSYSTSTVFATSVYTITSCAASVTDCPAKIGQVTTEIVSLYTTICPVTATETSAPSSAQTSAGIVSSSASPAAEGASSAPATSVQTSPVVGEASSAPATSVETSAGVLTSAPASTTSTVYGTTTYTITSCAADVTDCPAKIGQVTTDIVFLYTTVCPVAEAASSAATATTEAVGVATSEATSEATTTSTSTIFHYSTVTQYRTSSYVTPSSVPTNSANCSVSSYSASAAPTNSANSSAVVKFITETLVPLKSNATAVATAISTSIGKLASTSAVLTSSVGVVVTPTETAVAFTGGASGLKSGSALAFILAGAVALFL